TETIGGPYHTWGKKRWLLLPSLLNELFSQNGSLSKSKTGSKRQFRSFLLSVSQRKTCFPETQEKVRHLKRKNAELAVIAKRLEERARKLQEANLRVVSDPSLGLCKRALARQRATDLQEQANALLMKDKQINALQRECQELQAKIMDGKEGPPCLPLLDFQHLLRESQKEVLRLQRQIALKNFKAALEPCGQGSEHFSVAFAMDLGLITSDRTICSNGFSPTRVSQPWEELCIKRKQCEHLEHEVKKKHKRCVELVSESPPPVVDLTPRATFNRQKMDVESENADLRLQVSVVTEERDSALQKTQELQDRLESLGQALKHMRDVAERRQQLEHQHEKALQALQKKKDEVRQLQQAQAEARKKHEGAVQLLEARVRELENQCRSHTEQFNFLSQELSRFHLQTGKLGLPSTSSFCSSLVTSEIVFATCQSSPQLPNGFKQKGDNTSSPPGASKKAIKKLEAQSSSSRSESMHNNSPKSCPTPEVSHGCVRRWPTSKHSPYIHFSYNPFDGPNENPEAELPLTAGEYIYVYGEMDEDGFFEGELMDGRRGLVPSNFVERLADDDLVAFLPQELHDLSQSSPLERSFLSISISSGERSDYSSEELNASTAPSRLEGDQGEGGISIAVPYPRKVTLIKQFASSLLVTWDPPLVPSGSCLDIQSYNVYVDTELRENVKAGSQMKAMIDKLDLKTKAYRVSIQSVSEKGSSDRLQCTFLVGCGFVLAPSQLQVRSVKATSVELSWISSNSNFSHTIYLNGGACDIVKAGIYWYTFRNLNPNTSYIATVEIQPQQTFWKPFPEGEEQALSTEIQFTTSSAGSPDAPLDVRVDPGPTSGILVISWLPVTIDAEGSSNGVRVTGYAVYADGQKVMEVTSPTAGSVLIEISQLQILQLCQEVTVRTVSLYGESVDSVAAQIPSALLEEVERSSESQFRGRPSRLLGGGAPALVTRTSQVPGKELPSQAEKRSEPGNRPLNILTDHNRGSDLSDITEEEEEEDEKEEEEEKPVSAQLDLGDTDSDEEILERILEMPLQKKCSKALFSIPEVTEEEEEQEQEDDGDDDDDEGWDPVLNQPISIPLEKKTVESFQSKLPNHTRRTQSPLGSWSKKNHNLSELILPERTLLQKFRGECMNETSSCSGRWDAVQGLPRCLSPENLEIDIEYDSNEEEDLTITSTPVSLLSSDGRADGSPTDCEEEWSDCSSQSGSIQSSARRELKRSSSWEGESTDWSTSPSHSPGHCGWRKKASGAPEENPSLESADDKGSMRLFVALFDYDPVSMSPNRDAAEEELPFQEGQILKVYGHKDADGFYRGECAGRTGFIPCNMVSELRVDSDSARKQLIEEGHISTDMLMESLGNGAFSPPPPHLSNHPSKPRRSKKGQRNSS
uniref:SH3 domain-containing protein n=1 Tax=Pseudonaja textilis TaxID=8673 RepID=A0A670Y4G4_PSETE